MLLADSKGASLIVAVGTHASLVEFLDKGRAGMASTFLTRLRVGPKLVDAKGVSRIYRSQIKTWHLILFVLSGVDCARDRAAVHRRGLGVRQRHRCPDPGLALLDKGTLHLINFRYHIVSLMAVFIALSVGIAVGVSLSPSVDQGLLQQAAQDRKQVTDLRAELDRRKALDDYRNAYDEQVGTAVTAGVLNGQRVAMVAMPDAPASVLRNISNAVVEAGGTVVRDVKVNADAFDAARAEDVSDALANYFGPLGLNETMSSATRLGVALGRSIGSKEAEDRDALAIAVGESLEREAWSPSAKTLQLRRS